MTPSHNTGDPLAVRVLRVVRTIPRGKVATYGGIARFLGTPRGARAVGRALNGNPDLVVVPCHRVVRSDGVVGGYARGVSRKIALLREEGVVVRDGRVDLGAFLFHA